MTIITITGTPGSGKSTLAKLLAKRLGYKQYSIGDLRREYAASRGITLADLNALSDSGIEDTDTKFDEYQHELGSKAENFVIDSRLGFHFIPHSIKLYIDAEERTRARRFLLRDSVGEDPVSMEQAIRLNRERVASDKKRYMKYYGLEPYCHRNYDLVLDSTHDTPEQLVKKVLEKFPQLSRTN